MINTVRKYHRWLMLLAGLQVFIWSATGLYMVSMNIHFIHGESMQKPQASILDLTQVNYSINDFIRAYPSATRVALVNLIEQPVYRFRVTSPNKEIILVSAKTGQRLPQVDQQQAIDIVLFHSTLPYAIAQVDLIMDNTRLPDELSPRHLPVWRIAFKHFSAPTFYVSRQSGEIVATRHHFWRLFDWMWRFHIMDYDDGENVANWLLMLVSITGVLAAFFGAVLTYLRISRPLGKEPPNA